MIYRVANGRIPDLCWPLRRINSSRRHDMDKHAGEAQKAEVSAYAGRRRRTTGFVAMIGTLFSLLSPASGSHQGHERHTEAETHEAAGPGYPVPGASFQVFLERGRETDSGRSAEEVDAQAAVQTVVEALDFMIQHRQDYPRFDEALKKNALEKIVIEPTVVNQDGK